MVEKVDQVDIVLGLNLWKKGEFGWKYFFYFNAFEHVLHELEVVVEENGILDDFSETDLLELFADFGVSQAVDDVG